MSVSTKDRKMTDAALHYEMGNRVSSFLRTRHPKNTAKLVATELGVAEITVKKWLAGRFPGAAHFAQMLHRFGAAFAAHVLEPAGDWTAPLRAAVELDAIEARLDELDQRAARARREVAEFRSALR